MRIREHNQRRIATQRAALLLFAVVFIGVIGFKWIGHPDASWLDAVYMTTITVTTVGYGEVIEISHSPIAKVFTISLLFFGVGTFLNFFSNVTAYLIEGSLDQIFWRRRMARETATLSDHFIVCGAGHTGVYIVRELIETNRPFVVIDNSRERLDALEDVVGPHLQIVADATDDESLVEAGIERARGLFACISNDKDNLIVTFSGRMLGGDKLRIVSRAIDERSVAKIRKAGADAVVSPNAIGGLRIVSEMIRPTVVTFLDHMLRDKSERLRVEEITVASGSQLDGMTVEQLRASLVNAMTLVAIHEGGDWIYNPHDELKFTPAMQLVFIGSPEVRGGLESLNTP